MNNLGIPGLLGMSTLMPQTNVINQNSSLPDNSTDIGGIAGSLAGLALGGLGGGLLAKKLVGKLGTKAAVSASEKALIKRPGALGQLKNKAMRRVTKNKKGLIGLGAGLGGLLGAQTLGNPIHQQNAIERANQMATGNQLAAEQRQIDMQSIPARQVQF